LVTIIPFEEKYAADFRRLNIEWLNEYFEVEPYDEYQLSHPLSEITGKGGHIFLAKENDMIVGTAALMKETSSSFELTKMCVTRSSQGKGISKMLLDACLNLARDKNWDRLFLYSSTRLIPAIQLYRNFGFKEIPLEKKSHYSRSNIKMELKLR
jgi:GNAT superfamily N-acetyltransferase